MNQAKTIRAALLAVLCSVSAAVFADPVNYWFLCKGGDTASLLTADGYGLKDGTATSWVDGNWLCWIGTYYYNQTAFPDKAEAAATMAKFNISNLSPNNNTTASGTMRPYGIKFGNGTRSWGGALRIELGAGGYQAVCGDEHRILITGGLHLTASQTWDNNNCVTLSDKTFLTAEPGVVWTAQSTPGRYAWSQNRIKVNSANNLAGCHLVLAKSEKFILGSATAAVGFDTLTYDGPEAFVSFDTSIRPKLLDAAYAKRLILRNGGCLGSAQGFDGATVDLESVTVEDGTSVLGEGAAYAVKGGETLPVIVAEGAVLKIVSLPTEGALDISGAGALEIPDDMLDKVGLADFSGAITVSACCRNFASLTAFPKTDFTFVDSVLRIDSLAGFGGTLTIAGKTRMALPPTEAWPATLTVTVSDTATLYLPEGYGVDATKILGTANYLAVGKGYDAVTTDVTIGAGEEFVIAYDGFTADTKITLNGGTITFPVSATVASDVEVAAKSVIGSAEDAVGCVSGRVTVRKDLVVRNDVRNLYPNPGWPCGRTVLSGGGWVGNGVSIRDAGGELEFRGGKWTFESGELLSNGADYTDGNGTRIILSSGATLDFTNPLNWANGVTLASGGYYPVRLEITEKSVLTLQRYQKLRLTTGSWRESATVIVDDATLKLVGSEGVFGDTGWSNDARQAKVVVRNGGVIETDRVLFSTTPRHSEDTTSWLGEAYAGGLSLELDGGIYRLGSGFGADAEHEHPTFCRNHLFAMSASIPSNTAADFDHTAEIKLAVGVNGGTFDLSAAKAQNTSFTNAILNASVSGYESLGPRWTVDGPLTVKGNGSQELVLNGLAQGQVSEVKADGAVLKVVGAFDESYAKVELGAVGGGVKVADAAEAPRQLAVTDMMVAAGGTFDAAYFNGEVTTVETLTFADGAVLGASNVGGAVPQLATVGSVKLADAMGYSAAHGLSGKVKVLSAGSIAPAAGDGVTWAKVIGPSKTVEVEGSDISFSSHGLLLLVK